MKTATILFGVLLGLLPTGLAAVARGDVTREQVEHAIRRGTDFLKARQQPDGSWPGEAGMTALASLALTTAGEPVDSPAVSRSLEALVRLDDGGGHQTYTLGLKIMALAADPKKYGRTIGAFALKLENGQIRNGGRQTSGAWGYMEQRGGGSTDNSNSQYAVLGLNSAAEAGVRIEPIVWQRARRYWEDAQCRDGGFAYKSGMPLGGTGSMSCAGISSLIISGSKLIRTHERLVDREILHCGEDSPDLYLLRGLDWLAVNFDVRNNINSGLMWKYYYLYGLERVGRLSGLRYFGRHDWYREGAQELVSLQDPISGYWRGVGQEADPVLATSFALLFLAKGRSPVLINKIKHGPGRDWNNDPDDDAHLTNLISRDWGHLLTWQVVDPSWASVEDMLQAPIIHISGHDSPVFSVEAKGKLRKYVENGGLILADACCGRPGFDRGFRALMRELFPEPENELRPLDGDHPVWRARFEIDPNAHPLWGIEHGCRTVVIYSPTDLSCYWNQMEARPDHPGVIVGSHLGQNIVEYATGRELPADKLAAREIGAIAIDVPKRGALHIGKLRHGGDWNVAPLAIPNLTTMLREKLKFDVVINHKELGPDDPNIVNFPLIYMHGRAALTFSKPQMDRIRRHLSPGGGTLFADAACGSDVFDAAFRKFIAELYPDASFMPIPPEDPFYTQKIGFDLAGSQLNPSAGGRKGTPMLEGLKIDGRWAVIYSKFDLGCALERHAGLDCKGYTHESALRIASNIVIYSTLP